jgi:hypothetical protein
LITRLSASLMFSNWVRSFLTWYFAFTYAATAAAPAMAGTISKPRQPSKKQAGPDAILPARGGCQYIKALPCKTPTADCGGREPRTKSHGHRRKSGSATQSKSRMSRRPRERVPGKRLGGPPAISWLAARPGWFVIAEGEGRAGRAARDASPPPRALIGAHRVCTVSCMSNRWR